MNILQTIGHSFTHLFYPNVCAGCGSDVVSSNQLLCLHCLDKMPYTRFQFFKPNPVEKIFWGRLQVQHAAGIFYLTKDSMLEKLMYQLKYKGRKDVGEFCGQLMGEAIRNTPFATVDALIPLPLFPKKERMRGYNQSAMICEGISGITQIPVWKNVVQRTTGTDTQTRKNRVQRWANMQDRFHVPDAARLARKHVLLVDDVITTGATLESCGTVLVDAGATLSVLTLGYASSR